MASALDASSIFAAVSRFRSRSVARWTFAASAATLLLSASPSRADDDVWHVRSGDALSAIAKEVGTSVDRLRALNNLRDDRIQVGQQLIVSAAASSAADAPVDGARITADGASTTESDPTSADAPPTPAESATAAVTPNAPDGRPKTTWTEHGETYHVQRGDVLGVLAQRFGMSLATLVDQNPGLDPDRIHEGQALIISTGRRRLVHRIERGENLSRIAAQYEVSVDELLGWNPRLSRNRIRRGQPLVVYTPIPDSRSESIGTPSHGQLVDGVRLSPHPGYVIRDRARAYGTAETIRWVRDGFDAVTRRHPNAPRVRVHDISDENGGFLDGHRSHQSGRDVDISLYHQSCGPTGCPFRNPGMSGMDVAAQWTLLEHWLERDMLEAVFLDYALQSVLYRYAKKHGATKEELNRWFQYPKGRTHPAGVIRHYPKHSDHLHVRFVCHDTDESCKTLRPLLHRGE